MTMRSRPRPLLASLVAIFLALAAPEELRAQPLPSAQATREASTRFQKGVEFYRDAEYQAALLEFKRAYELSPNYRVLYNLGQASRELKDHASALTSFERYLAEGGREIEPRRRRDVEKWIEELRPKVARMSVLTSVPGAEVTVDDVPSGTTPLPAPLRVNAGRRKVQATLSGHQPVQRLVDLAGADDATVTLELTPVPSAPLVVAPPPEPPRPAPAKVAAPPPSGSSWPWVGLASTGALGTATVILGIRAVAAQSDFEDILDQRTDAAAVEDARGEAQGFALAADILGGVTALAAATTIVLFVIEARDDEGAPGSATRVRVGPTGLLTEGTF